MWRYALLGGNMSFALATIPLPSTAQRHLRRAAYLCGGESVVSASIAAGVAGIFRAFYRHRQTGLAAAGGRAEMITRWGVQ
jgi:hypothetical protein